MQMGKDGVHCQQEKDAESETAGGGKPSWYAGGLGLFHCGKKQAEDGSRYHDPCGKAEKNTLNLRPDGVAEKENEGRAQSRHGKGKAGCSCGPENRLCH